MSKYSINIKVTDDDLDDLHHVNNVRYLDWIQQISKEHWKLKADKHLQEEFIWVVRKHIITYHSSAQINDNLLLETNIASSKGAISTRQVRIKNNLTNTLVVTSETEWCLINPSNLRPVRIPEKVNNLFLN